MAEQHAIDQHALVAHHFDTMEQQHEANILGMWIFLMTELMLFGGLFLAYSFYRAAYDPAFVEASQHLNVTIGAVNTAVLIVSSLMVALAVRSAQIGNRRQLMLFLTLTILLGLTFLGFKAIEYAEHFRAHEFPGIGFTFEGPDPAHAQMFFFLYFVMTGIHALHMIIGLSIMSWILFRAWRGAYSPANYTGVDLGALYWHLIDIIWVFIFPLLYLFGRHVH